MAKVVRLTEAPTYFENKRLTADEYIDLARTLNGDKAVDKQDIVFAGPPTAPFRAKALIAGESFDVVRETEGGPVTIEPAKT